jgi:hypothetical protein
VPLASLALLMACCRSQRTVSGAAQTKESYTSNSHTEAKLLSSDFVPDGDLSKVPWKHATWVEFERDPKGQVQHPEAATRVAALWSASYIYFAFSCPFDSLNVYEGEDVSKERWELWNRDVVEVFLNPEPNRLPHYYEFEVAPNNQWIDLEIDKTKEPFNEASWNSGFEHATHVNEKNHVWTAEMRIPLSSMNVSEPKAGATWRVNFFRASGHGGDEKRIFLAWSSIPEGKTFHVPSRFGTLRLVN